MSTLNFHFIWDKIRNIPTQPCFGYFLHGGCRMVGLIDFGISIFSIGLIGFEITFQLHVKLKALYQNGEYLKYYFRIACWTSYFIYKIIFLALSVLLFKAAKRRSSRLCRTWVVMSIVTILALLLTLYVNHYMFRIQIVIHAFFWFFFVYKLYCIHVVWSFVREIESYGGFNAALSGLTDAEVEEFEKGCPPDRDMVSGDGGALSTVQNEAFNRDFEITTENLEIDEASLLGSGAFGSVFRGKLLTDTGITTVAVKTVNSTADVAYFKTLLTELKVMTYVGHHSNVVSLLGACTANIRQKKLYMVMEFCPYGNLHEFLKTRRGLFMNFVKDGEIRADAGNTGYTNVNPANTVTTLDLFQWSLQCTTGLELLEEKKVVHGDIAARNILLGVGKIAKISDFGLAKKMYQYTSVVKEEVLLPWRWMAPESLIDMEFSSKSDVWSFATTIWEIFSLSELPFPGFSWDKDFISKLHSGLRMSQPRNATNDLYQLMLKCWRPEPLERPTFSEIKVELEKILMDAQSKVGLPSASPNPKDDANPPFADVVEVYVALPNDDDSNEHVENENVGNQSDTDN